VNGRVKIDKQFVYFHISTISGFKQEAIITTFQIGNLGFDSRKANLS